MNHECWKYERIIDTEIVETNHGLMRIRQKQCKICGKTQLQYEFLRYDND